MTFSHLARNRSTVTIVTPTETCKVGTTDHSIHMLRDQYDFMQAHKSPIFPKLKGALEHGYRMETLGIPSRHKSLRWLTIAREALEHQIWNQRLAPEEIPSCEDSYKTLRTRVEDRLRKLTLILSPSLQERVFRMVWHLQRLLPQLKPSLTHGNPVVSNLVWRSPTQVVILSPRPWQHRMIPPYREADLGRMLTSVYGFEEFQSRLPLGDIVKLDEQLPHQKSIQILLAGESQSSIEAARVFCVIHWLETLDTSFDPNHNDRAKLRLEMLLDDDTLKKIYRGDMTWA